MPNGLEITGGNKAGTFFKELQKKLTEASSVEIGFFPESIHPKANVPVAYVAYMNEVGNPLNTFNGNPAPVPPRPFMRETEANNSEEWGKAFYSGLKAVKYHSSPALKGLGSLIQMQIRNSITNWSDPMNSSTTIRLKGFDAPLIEKGIMVRSVDVRVQE